jgi:serralysin
VRAAGIDPLAHYMTHGWREGRDPDAAKFDTSSYLAAYADVRLAGLDPLSHYLQHGYLEGRQTFGDGSWA